MKDNEARMKVFIMYDRVGKICGTAASAVKEFGVGVPPGLFYLEEEHNVDPSDLPQHLLNLHMESKVDVKSDPPKRVPKK